MRARNVPLSGELLQQKARDFACILGCDDFKASSGWLQRFKDRHSIVGKVVSGESAAADAIGAADWLRDCESTGPSADIADSWQQLCEQGAVPSNVTLQDYISSDACVIVTEEMDDEAIIESVTNKRMREDEVDEEPEAPTYVPTSKEVMDAIDLLRTYAGAQSQEQALAALSTYERHVTPMLWTKRQTKLTDFMTAP
ncbi:hypothetical protein HPB47_002002 [Ixodes persulcatus]|uniref:Uncharacterized protein n=1 Tax=Ixodes persulcatus TaxID=34615 RepID=A0AC60PMQ2_IXOPE|nr:hypothetical protein HPB47_002002 [Ixodes persulcatus]